MCGLFSLCNKCGNPLHKIDYCSSRITKWMTEINQMKSKTKDNKSIIIDLIRNNDNVSNNCVDNSYKYYEKAPTGRSKSRVCFNFIEKGTYRVGKDSIYKGCPSKKWFHEKCKAVNNNVCHHHVPKYEDSYEEYKPEIALTGRSKCRLCYDRLEKRTYRMGKYYGYKGIKFDIIWFHRGCYYDAYPEKCSNYM
uniref:PARP-type domain-containing protein n=1 Tax=viral metagenome TaxID=1070528 RepID=A0A6C0J577_9ZZZZ